MHQTPNNNLKSWNIYAISIFAYSFGIGDIISDMSSLSVCNNKQKYVVETVKLSFFLSFPPKNKVFYFDNKIFRVQPQLTERTEVLLCILSGT